MLEREIEALFDACLLTDEEMAQFEEYMQDQPNTVTVRYLYIYVYTFICTHISVCVYMHVYTQDQPNTVAVR